MFLRSSFATNQLLEQLAALVSRCGLQLRSNGNALLTQLAQLAAPIRPHTLSGDMERSPREPGIVILSRMFVPLARSIF